ncbi:MAG: metallophosphoesterase [Bacilli bacterium]|nr:metallophosphoesterase [Bacilli bacterium]MDD4411851.1 metallophosphoesterase [Bacilli bacterium]
MKIAIFSDIHGNYQALEAILNDIKGAGYDEIIYLGDAIAIGPDNKKCLELLKNSNVNYLLGNHELYFLNGVELDNALEPNEVVHQKWVASQLDQSDREFLRKCSLDYTLEIYDKKIKFSHFLLSGDSEIHPFVELFKLLKKDTWFKYSKDYEYYFVGHEHNSYMYDEYLEKNNIVSNLILVGSSGCIKENQTYYIGLEVDQESISFSRHSLSYDRGTFIETINGVDYPEKDFMSKTFFGISEE